VSDPKQIIVMRTDLKMRKGKMIAQGAHASMKVLLDRSTFSNAHEEPEIGPSGQEDDFRRVLREVHNATPPNLSITLNPAMQTWLLGLFTKICVRVDSEEALDEVYANAMAAGLPCAMIVDAGKTEFNGVPTKTCCAIGPALPAELDPITGHLKLL